MEKNLFQIIIIISLLLLLLPHKVKTCESLDSIDYDSDSQKQITSNTIDDCCSKVSSSGAQAAVFDKVHKACWLKFGKLKPKPCVASGCVALCAVSGSCPRPSPQPGGYNLNFDTTDDYLNIGANIDPNNPSSYYYFVIGDWGGKGIGCDFPQDRVAQKMREYRKSRPNDKLLFVLGVGDSFYWTGLGSDFGGLKRQWKQVYTGAGIDDLTNVPWFNVMGNHDWGNNDAQAACPHLHERFACDKNKRASGHSGCGGLNPFTKDDSRTSYSSNQLDGSKQGILQGSRDEFKNFMMPDFSYFYTIKKLDLEVIGLETSVLFDFNGLGGDGFGPKGGANQLPKNCGGSQENLKGWMHEVSNAGQRMFDQRNKESSNRNIAIFQHYPGNTYRSQWLANPERQKDRAEVLSFWGHTHNQQCAKTENGRCVEVLTGGGGGCCPTSCNDGTPNGFVVVSFNKGSDGRPKQFVDCQGQDHRCSVPAKRAFWKR
jgi:hypothetical protein